MIPHEIVTALAPPGVAAAEGARACLRALGERLAATGRGGAEMVWVSGTAAILGERSVAPGDVAKQTRVTIGNIAALLGDGRLSHLRAYVKHAPDIPVVRDVCAQAYDSVPSLFVEADVCREELLVELEGALFRRSQAEPGRQKKGARSRRARAEEVLL